MPCNILLTSAGRRSYLVDYFRAALRGRGKVVCANCFPDSPAMLVADEALVVEQSWRPSYVESILRICEEYDIRAIFSLHDLDTLALAPHLEAFSARGIVAFLPRAEWARISLDKHECGRVLAERGIGTPRTWIRLDDIREDLEEGSVHYPIFVKARMGFGSLGASICREWDELTVVHARATREAEAAGVSMFARCTPGESVVMQEYLSGDEYCLGIINDLSGRLATGGAIKVRTMRAGETDTVEGVDASQFSSLIGRLSSLVGHRGWLGVDVKMQGGKPLVIDVNPRFTGDYPFHHLAGFDVPGAIVAWLNDEDGTPFLKTGDYRFSAFKDLVPRFLRTPVLVS